MSQHTAQTALHLQQHLMSGELCVTTVSMLVVGGYTELGLQAETLGKVLNNRLHSCAVTVGKFELHVI